LFLIEGCCTGCLRKNISIFYQMYEIGRVMLFILLYIHSSPYHRKRNA
jgi:hypothetical protein